MSSKKEQHFNYISLPRGGYLVDTEAGYIQFGAPPETIKDTMTMEKGVPRVYVVMEKMFDWAKGISLAEIEFPLYYNYFIKKTKTHVLCRKNQVKRLKAVLQEALFGPKNLDLSIDYDSDCSVCKVPDIRKEMNYFRAGMKLSDVVGIHVFEDKKCSIDEATITYDESGTFKIFHGKKLVSAVPGSFAYKPSYSIGERLPEPYNPPLFSITCLGPSHGFDPTQNTSGYIIWLNHHGIMIDPPGELDRMASRLERQSEADRRDYPYPLSCRPRRGYVSENSGRGQDNHFFHRNGHDEFLAQVCGAF